MSQEDIRTVCRIRPINGREAARSMVRCLSVTPDSKRVVFQGKQTIPFDFVAHEATSQDDLFTEVGVPVTKGCFEGYNGTILCYGQTGSGYYDISVHIFAYSHVSLQ